MVGVAQLVRAPGCGPGGRGFETHHSPHFTFKNTVVFRLFGLKLKWKHNIAVDGSVHPVNGRWF